MPESCSVEISACRCQKNTISPFGVKSLLNKPTNKVMRLQTRGVYIYNEISKRKANWIGHILRRNCLPQRVIEGKIKGGIDVT